MRINHNISALNTYRQLSLNNTNGSRSMEKLSSGFRINRAGDDAAGLAISEKMRGQIRGLDMASRNAQDGISLIQTAEGGLNETHSILQRMRELAVQSASDTNTASDRSELQKEVDQLSEELSRIGTSMEFNTQPLLNGTFTGTFQIGANQGQNITIDISDMRGFALNMAGDAKIDLAVSVADGGNTAVDLAEGTYQVKESATTADAYELIDKNGVVAATSDDGFEYASSTGDDTITFDEAVKSGTIKIDDAATATATGGVDNTGLQAGYYKYVASKGGLVDKNGNVIAKGDGTNFTTLDGATTVVTFSAELDDGTEFKVGGIDISSQKTADKAITTIQSAIETVSAERSKLGAVQNRLDHTINNLGTSSENLSSAESRIRDVDMAKEMMEFTKNNILTQAATAMLAQANQQPQGVLQLLQ